MLPSDLIQPSAFAVGMPRKGCPKVGPHSGRQPSASRSFTSYAFTPGPSLSTAASRGAASEMCAANVCAPSASRNGLYSGPAERGGMRCGVLDANTASG